MIRLTRLKGEVYHLNPFLIETIESTPDTVITLINGKKYISKETAAEVMEQIIDFYGRFSLLSISTMSELSMRQNKENG